MIYFTYSIQDIYIYIYACMYIWSYTYPSTDRYRQHYQARKTAWRAEWAKASRGVLRWFACTNERLLTDDGNSDAENYRKVLLATLAWSIFGCGAPCNVTYKIRHVCWFWSFSCYAKLVKHRCPKMAEYPKIYLPLTYLERSSDRPMTRERVQVAVHGKARSYS